MERRMVIAGTGSGVGKTTMTIGLMSALRSRGLEVQGFKCGPDYIDPSYHTAVTGRSSRNLDSWMLSEETVRDIYVRSSKGAHISIIEGVMGFFDGKNPSANTGSTAEISMITESPVVLVVNCASMARSAAAIVKGFQMFTDGLDIVGVIANKVGSEGHFKLVKTAIEQECNIPVIGYLQRDHQIEIPERHLGLVPSIERGELEPFFQQLGELVERTVDIDKLLQLSEKKPLQGAASSLFDRKDVAPSVRIAVAKDAAFNFYYPENLELLEASGAELVYFSPLAGEVIPSDVNGLYIGGGFPEEFVHALSRNVKVKTSIKRAVENGLPTLAECGGYMYLTESIITTDQCEYSMAGIIPGKITMQSKLAALGYREIAGEPHNYLLPEGLQARGHEFHYSTFQSNEQCLHAYSTKGMRGMKKEGCLIGNLIAGYTHLHFASCPELVHNWIAKCKENGMDESTFPHDPR
ncbi:cobyrinate a,c-diamide synthase [Pseudalkalibacillus sp. A8]|uniref:cobyrinate a,c-diamide synthase n=1 Tax=Pseudalkalibacillus sp. A8 TaxID=3382641 RepID=UPI0038B6144D